MPGVYASLVMKQVIAHLCEALGWDAANPQALEYLVSITEYFLREVTLHMMRGSELANRSEANLDDLAYAFRQCGIDLNEIWEYVANVESLPLPYVGHLPSKHRSDE